MKAITPCAGSLARNSDGLLDGVYPSATESSGPGGALFMYLISRVVGRHGRLLGPSWAKPGTGVGKTGLLELLLTDKPVSDQTPRCPLTCLAASCTFCWAGGCCRQLSR